MLFVFFFLQNVYFKIIQNEMVKIENVIARKNVKTPTLKHTHMTIVGLENLAWKILVAKEEKEKEQEKLKLIFFAMIAGAFGGRFECDIFCTSDTAQHHVHIFRFHNVTTLAHGCDWFRNFKTVCVWCRWNGIWFTIPAACVRIYWKLNAIRNFDSSAVS